MRFSPMCPRPALFALTLGGMLAIAAPSVQASDAPTGLADGHFDGLGRDAYLAEMQKTGEAFKAATFLLHTRMDPNADVPPVPWSEAEKTQAACMYDGAAAAGLLDEHSNLLIGMSRVAAFITNTPGLTMANAAQFSGQMAAIAPSPALMDVLNACGA